MSAQPLLLIQVGSPPDDVRAREGDVPVWFLRALGPDGDALQVVRVFEGEPLPAPGEHRAAIITGSWAMVTDRLDWSEATAD
jgi:GMP synthase (glutamine-hydrolysing)